MMVDRYTKCVLTIIALALSVLAARPLIAARPAIAQESCGNPCRVIVVGGAVSWSSWQGDPLFVQSR